MHNKVEGETIKALFDITCDVDSAPHRQIDTLLRYGCERFAMEIGIVAKIDSHQYRIIRQLSPAETELRDGDCFVLDDTDCAITLAADTAVGFAHAAAPDTEVPQACRRFDLKAYFGIPVHAGGRLFGTLSFASRRRASKAFDVRDHHDLELMATWLGAALYRWQQENALKKGQERFRTGFYASPGPMLIVDQRGRIEQVNAAAQGLFKYTEDQLQGKPIELLLPDKLRPAHPHLRECFMHTPAVRPMGAGRDLMAQNAQGEVFPVEVGLNPVRTEDGIVVLCAVVDITERKRYQDKILEQTELLKRANTLLSRQAATDALTSLSNRRHIMAKLKEYLSLACRSGECVSVLMLDVDHFKNYNDAFGHTAGDQALKSIARELSRQTRDVDIVARYGGEEFIILLPGTDREGALVIAERIRQAVENLDHLHRPITLSGGVATVIEVDDPAKPISNKCRELIERADHALYWSKQNGRNRVVHFESCQ